MNLKNVGGVALSLVAVACIALGGCKEENNNTTNNIIAPVIGDGSAVAINAELPQAATPARETAQPQATTRSETPAATEKPAPKNKQKAGWFWTICGSVALGFAEIVSRMLGESLAKRLLEYLKGFLMKNWKKIVGFFKREAKKNEAESTAIPAEIVSIKGQETRKKAIAPFNTAALVVNALRENLFNGERWLMLCENFANDFYAGEVAVYSSDVSRVLGNVKFVASWTSRQTFGRTIERSINRETLNILKENGGVFLLVGSKQEKTPVFYYKTFFADDIEILLRREKESKKNPKVELFPLRPGDEAINLFAYFAKESPKLNAALKNVPANVVRELVEKEVNEITVVAPITLSEKKDLRDVLFHQDARAYAVSRDGRRLRVQIQEIRPSLPEDAVVAVGEEIFYRNVVRVISAKSDLLKIGDSLEILPSKSRKKMTLRFTLTSILSRSLIDLRFFAALCENGAFTIGKGNHPIDKALLPPSFAENLAKTLEYRQQIAEAFQQLRLSLDVDLNQFSDEDFRNADLLVRAIVKKEPIPGLPCDLPPVARVKVGAQLVLLRFTPTEEEGVYRVDDFFIGETTIYARDDAGTTCQTSCYAMLTQYDLVNDANFDFSEALPSFQRLNDPRALGETNLFLLEALKAFDECEKRQKKERAEKLMQMINAFDEWLLQQGAETEPPTTLLNHFQIVKRQRACFTDEEKKTLLKISNNKGLESIYRFAACVLLEEKIRSESIWQDELTPDLQNEFKTWPIARFFAFDEQSSVPLNTKETNAPIPS